MTEFVKVDYTGRDKETGKIFDTTEEKPAKEIGIYNEKMCKPAVMLLGAGHLIKGFENALKGMKAGEKKTVEIKPEDAYGFRNPELVKLLPMQPFIQNNIKPAPGMVLNLQGNLAKVQSVSGGRVRMDFNHELAGKTLIFDIKMVGKIEKEDEKITALFERIFPEVEKKLEIKKTAKETELLMPKDADKVQNYQQRKIGFIQEIKKHVGVENIKVTEQY